MAEPVIPDFGRGSSCVRENGTFCWDWVNGHWSDTLRPALVQHVALTLIAIAVGFTIAFALALLAHRRGWIDAKQLRTLADSLAKSEYGQYLQKLAERPAGMEDLAE